MTDARPLLLWTDLETTGLASTDTVLETAWFVTDTDGIPLTPLRSRYCSVQIDDEPVTPEEGGYWVTDSPRCPSLFVRDMHAASGLTISHAVAQSERSAIRNAAALDALIFDDLLAAADGATPAGVHISGDGVGHFDQGVYGRLFTCTTSALHYRPRDVSHALDVLGDHQGGVVHLDDVLAGNVALHKPLASELEVGAYPTYGERSRPDVAAWLGAPENPHRAAPDAVRAWATYRILRHSEANLAGLGLARVLSRPS